MTRTTHFLPSQTPLFQNAIGVFDSGVGGLSVLRAIRTALPAEHLVYVADTAHAPYGDQSPTHITQRTLALGQWLASHGVKALTIACNTATVVAANTLREQTHLPVVAIEPAIKPALAHTRSGVVGVLATRQTVQSASVARLVERYGANKQVLLQACPGLVEQVEQADLHSSQTRALLEQFMDPLLKQGADTLVLGCTHYPFLRELIAEVAGPAVTLIDPAEAVARELKRRLSAVDALQQDSTTGGVRFFTTGDVASVQAAMDHLWEEDVQVACLQA